MITTSVKTSGARWAEVEEKVQQAVAGAVRETAVEIADRARALAPVRTGHLRDSIEATETGPYEWDVAANADYAQFVELGTSRMAPQPFLLPAAQQARAGFFQRLAAAIRSALK
jgi:HK97 gp10 family phage protein